MFPTADHHGDGHYGNDPTMCDVTMEQSLTADHLAMILTKKSPSLNWHHSC